MQTFLSVCILTLGKMFILTFRMDYYCAHFAYVHIILYVQRWTTILRQHMPCIIVLTEHKTGDVTNQFLPIWLKRCAN